MDIKSKILFGVISLFVILSISASYYRYMVLRDYMIQAEVTCDPTAESCFVWTCSTEVEGECTGNEEEDVWYYKYIYRNAKNIPLCDPNDESCKALICSENEADCTYIVCSPETLLEYEIDGECSNPSNFEGTENTSEQEIDETSPEDNA